MSNELTLYDRQRLEYWLRSQISLRDIGKSMRRAHTILSREIARNSNGQRSKYRADAAQRLFERRKYKQHKGKLDKYPELKQLVINGLKNEWSPDVIAGKLKTANEIITISHESIYHYIYNKDGRYEGLYKYLRQAKNKRQKRHTRKDRKLPITERISIHQRPEVVGDRQRYGDWESDSVIFSKQKFVLSVQSERKSRLIRMHKILDKTAEETKYALINTVESLPSELFKTITFDNGGEGARHMEIKKEYGIETYFCDPFASWQKGGVENANKLIRHYLPRSTDLSKLSDRDIYLIQEKLNDRPRRCLGYQTPNEVINNYLKGGAVKA